MQPVGYRYTSAPYPARQFEMETDVLAAARSTSPDAGEERHHAVIVFADVVGYSRLMADDEPGALNRWTRSTGTC